MFIKNQVLIALFLLLFPYTAGAISHCPDLRGVFNCGDKAIPYLTEEYDRVLISQVQVGAQFEYALRTQGPSENAKSSAAIQWLTDGKAHDLVPVEMPLSGTMMDRSYRSTCSTLQGEQDRSFVTAIEYWKIRNQGPLNNFVMQIFSRLSLNADGDLVIVRKILFGSSPDMAEEVPAEISSETVCKRVIK